MQYLVAQACLLGPKQAAAMPKRSAPAQAAAAAAKARPGAITACPPCHVPVRVACLGGHAMCEWPCCDAPAAFACDSPCGRMLPCGRHACAKPCHALTGFPANGRLASAAPSGDAHAAGALKQGKQEPLGQSLPAGEACGACRALCGRRRAGCTHGCGMPCHGGACAPCGELVDSACHCGRSTVSAPCDALLTVRHRAPFNAPRVRQVPWGLVVVVRSHRSCGTHVWCGKWPGLVTWMAEARACLLCCEYLHIRYTLVGP